MPIFLWISFAFIFWVIGVLYKHLKNRKQRDILYKLLLKYQQQRQVVSYNGRLLNEINAARFLYGITPLGRTKFLDQVAAYHSIDMAMRKTCDYKDFENRANSIRKETGLSYIGENCYMFPSSQYNKSVSRKLVQGWLKSPGHRANILNSTYKRTGIGIAVNRGYIYATQLFTD